MQKKAGGNELEQQQKLRDKIEETRSQNKDVLKEIQLLKRMQHHQGQRLQELSNPESMPEKLRKLNEEKDWTAQRVVDLKHQGEQDKVELERQSAIVK